MRTEMLANFVRRAPEVLAEVEKERRPILLAQENGPGAYLVDMATFEDLKKRLWLLEGAAERGEQRGVSVERSLDEWRTFSQEESEQRMVK